MIYHFYKKYISRRNGGAACEASAYRAGEKIRDYYYGETYDYTNKTGIIHNEILLPPEAPTGYKCREYLWNEVERTEKRSNSRLAIEIEVALPIELLLNEHIAVVKEFVLENYTSKGVCADIAFHDKGTGNPHAHILLTTRTLECGVFNEKIRDLNTKKFLMELRENWAKILNRELEKRGLEPVSHESYMVQDIDKQIKRDATKHLGKKANELERRGIKTDRGNDNRDATKRNNEKIEKQNGRNRGKSKEMER
jgi:hypothetical protein